MGLTPLYLEMNNKHVLIVGTGSVGIRRTRRFLEAGATVSIITHGIDESIKKEFLSKGATFYEDNDLDNLIDLCDLIVVATDNHKLNEEISHKAKDKLVNCASDISLSNIIVPSTFDIGSVKVSLYTNSKSPLMAKQLRKKIQSIITETDIMNIELQEYSRELLKETVSNQEKRKKYMIEIKEDEYIQKLIENKELDEAKRYVKHILANT